MARKPAAAPSGARFDPARRYSVQLSRSVEYPAGSGRFLSPGADALELRGDVAAQLEDAIASAELVAEPPKGD
ncbi:hypothetical protein [Brevundimonas bacteroides]|uniref:hypothetical protein n=1 Tax=Brevundimonas bacteroides TaxID=74311 RepID=UPI000496F190|nr:hypothetical protein [Brevundimonas bacteroides]